MSLFYPELKIGLFALTGMGNSVLRALCEIGLKPVMLVSRFEQNSFPYYPETNISEEAASLGIPCYEGPHGELKAAKEELDLLIIATYHRILLPDLLAKVPVCINIHPSLLPAYRGPNPFYWVLRNGESETGISIIQASKNVDCGEVYWSEKIHISQDETQGSLRLKLSLLSARGIKKILVSYLSSPLKGVPQDEMQKTYYPPLEENDCILDLNQNINQICRKARALFPFPGALVNGRFVSDIVEVQFSGTCCSQPGSIVYSDSSILRVQVSDGEIAFALSR
jgi:methionyl-tRNA formyltransferase